MSHTVKLFEMPTHTVLEYTKIKPADTFKPKKAVPVMSNVSFDKVTQSILANQYALNCNEALKFTGYYKKELKGALNKTIPLLIRAESEEYDKIFDSQPDASTAVYTAVEALMKEVAAVSIPEYGTIVQLIKAYRADPKSLQGLVKKILRNSGSE